MGRIIGIDLGTTNSAVAVWDGQRARMIPSAEGTRLTPSVVAFGPKGEVLIGEAARHQAAANASRTIGSAKRFIGQQFDDVTEDREAVSYEVVAGKKGEALIVVGDKRLAPEGVSAHVLRELKKAAEAFLGEPVDGAVIAVPAYFNDHQRTATKKAGRLAGLDVRRIVNEPTAAALAYGLDKMHDHERVVAVYDFGGGTFDVSILSVGEDIVEVIATHGDTHLGGDDIDARVVAWLAEEFRTRVGGDVDDGPSTHQRLREAAEAAKIALTSQESAKVILRRDGDADAAPLETTLSRTRFEDLIADLIDRTFVSCAQALGDARKKPAEIDEIVLVGGSSHIPLVQRRVEEYFGRRPRHTLHPEEVVAFGAAVQAAILDGELTGIVLLDVTSLSLGIETNEGKTAVVIARNSTLPATATRTFTTTGDGQTAVQFHVVQGEAVKAAANDSLGRFFLEGIAAAPAGVPQLQVTFAIDINGMVQVSAVDLASGLSQTVTVSVGTATAPGLPLEDPVAGEAGEQGEQTAADLGLPSLAQATLEEADRLLGNADVAISAADRAGLTKKADSLRSLVEAGAGVEQVERSRLALRRAVTKIKKAQPDEK